MMLTTPEIIIILATFALTLALGKLNAVAEAVARMRLKRLDQVYSPGGQTAELEERDAISDTDDDANSIQ